ncbi:MAG: hypothetical protein K2N13_01435 [Paraprevotella sp.]|nr:hypothetical protein [Paraprevotella sp.]
MKEKEEDIIRRKTGSDTPFKVPEGYFEHFADALTNRLPAPRPRRTLLKRLKPAVWYAAAAVCGIALCGGLLSVHYTGQADTKSFIAADNDSEDSLDELLDYAMTDNMEIAYYLTTAD